jgi:hypothetical protein
MGKGSGIHGVRNTQLIGTSPAQKKSRVTYRVKEKNRECIGILARTELSLIRRRGLKKEVLIAKDYSAFTTEYYGHPDAFAQLIAKERQEMNRLLKLCETIEATNSCKGLDGADLHDRYQLEVDSDQPGFINVKLIWLRLEFAKGKIKQQLSGTVEERVFPEAEFAAATEYATTLKESIPEREHQSYQDWKTAQAAAECHNTETQHQIRSTEDTLDAVRSALE